MPWKECSVVEERLRFVARLLDGEAMTDLSGLVNDDVTLVEADAEAHAVSFFYVSIALRHCPLDCHRALGCVHNTAKLRQDPITSGVNDAAAVLFDHGEHDGLMLLEITNRAGVIRAHEGAVSSNVGSKNCHQPTCNFGLLWSFRHLPVSRGIRAGILAQSPPQAPSHAQTLVHPPRAVLGTGRASSAPQLVSSLAPYRRGQHLDRDAVDPQLLSPVCAARGSIG